MLTCFSTLSRNNRFGACLARGLTVEEAVEEIGEVVRIQKLRNVVNCVIYTRLVIIVKIIFTSIHFLFIICRFSIITAFQKTKPQNTVH